ncbi:MAG: TetR/AcrR family transcriptional regulator [Gemmatimonadaceae bacterium]
MQPTFLRLPLRQRKFAQTKLGILDATLRAVRVRPLGDVTVRELCDAVSISEASFFNYFPRKADVLLYYVQLWSLEMAWHAGRLAPSQGGLAAIGEVFALTARRVAENPSVMAEIVAAQARMVEKPEFAEISLAERLLAFPELDGMEDVRGQGLDELLPPLLERAVAAGELPSPLDRDTAVVALVTIFLGAPVALRRSAPAALEHHYREQLRLLWAGLSAHPEARAP